EGVDLLLSDSTNIDVEGDTGEEHEVATELHARMGAARGRFVVAQFASNVHRMGAVFEAARAHGRRVALLGRSVRTHSEVARNLRILEGIADLIVPPDDIQDVPPAKLCVIATGTQGERPAALSRLARNDHGLLQLEPGDTVVMSSRIIPGCERAVYQMIDGLERQGITVIHRKNAPGVHVSGHAARDEQRAYIELCRPKAFLPVHGTYHHLQRHAALAESLGVRETLVVENGAVIQLQNAHLQVVDHAVAGRVHIDRGEEVDPEQLRERRLVGELGHAVVAFPVNENGAIVGEVDVVARGVLHEEVEDDILEAACHYVASELARAPRSDTIDDLEDRARRSLKRFFGKQLRRKPIVTAVAVRVRR
ncbi:MAG: ribonuclease J, partial [Myxococcota bacterium]